MSGSQTDEIAPQLFECFIDRAEADLPEFFPKEVRGAVVAGPDLIRALADYSDSYESWGWRMSTDGNAFECFCVSHEPRPGDGAYLSVERQGEFWYIWRDLDGGGPQALVIGFDHVPVCTRTFRDAIRLAAHCHPVTRAPMAGCWIDLP